VSVSSLINYRLVEWNLTLRDWGELSRYLGRRMGAERTAVLGTLQFTNVNVERGEVERFLSVARGLSRLRRDIRAALDDMAEVLSSEPVRSAEDGRRVGSAQVIVTDQEHELVLIDTVTGEELTLTMRSGDDGCAVLGTIGWASVREPEALNAVVEWLAGERRRLWPK